MVNYIPHKNVIHVTSQEKSRNYKWESNAEKLKKGVEIVSIDSIEQMPIELKKQFFTGIEVEEGMVFIKEPIKGKYYLASEFADKSIQNLNDAIDHVAMLLGAIRITRKIESWKTVTRSLDGSVGGQYKCVEANVNSKKLKNEDYKRKYAEDRVFKGCNREIDYQKALKFCEEKGLMDNREIKKMLSSRNPEYANMELVNEVITEVTQNIDSLIDTAFSINELSGVFKLDASCKSAIQTSVRMIVSARIEYFPE